MFEKLTTLTNTRRALVVIIFLVLCVPITTVIGDFNRGEEAAHKLKPDWDYSCLFSVREEIIARFKANPTDAVEYFRVLNLMHTWEAALSKHNTSLWRAKGQEIHDRQMLQSMAAGMLGFINDARQRYDKVFGPMGMYTAGQSCENIALAAPWARIHTPFTPGLGWQFLAALFWMGVLSLFFTFLKFWDEENTNAFFRRLPLIIPLSFTVGPLAARYACADKRLIKSDVWLMTSFASALVSLFISGAVVVVKAQAPTTEKTKQSSTRSNSNGQDRPETAAEETTTDLVDLLRKAGLNQINVEALPLAANGKLPELTVEYLGAVKLGRLGSLKLFGFGELRPGSQFTNHSVSYFPFKKLPIGLTSEQGWNGKRFFGDAGVKWNISGTSGLQKPLGKVFDFATLSYTWKYAGAAPQRQFILVWDTKDWTLWKDKFSLSSEGFYRIRPGGTSNYGQPQILAQFGHCAWVKGLVQFDTAGRQVGVSAGAKFFFALR